ncbi:hypothetical protein NUW54_g3646 [Trametes sanguinea]|uniref:Uncharacterized protein n=1 Tax=Trametes sanguinea TaxID=158606 RepID=A0ACC1Q3R8_9APHY|nr:hypothetical protein NUW54_g3646 [Trametes sanguinea]
MYGHLPTEKHSQCNNHNAIKLANSKDSSHLAATGVGTVDCARHGMKRPASVGDLQKGERYVNMDYLLHSSLSTTTVPSSTISYDIACQYSVKLRRRFDAYSYATREEPDHPLGECGRLDGEGVERGWALANLAAPSTKEMGPGSRRDLLDDVFADQNWHKITKLPEALLTRIKAAVPQREVHVAAFDEYHAALPSEQTSVWLKAVEAWEANPSNSNPFLAVRSHITQATARMQLNKEDSDALRDGTAVILHQDFSSSTMLAAGLDLEEQQLRMGRDLQQMHEHATDLARAQMLERQNVLHRKIQAWTDIQQLFMPGVQALRSHLADESVSHLPHRIALLLPSAASQHIPCTRDILRQEWILREAQAHDALDEIRGRLEVRYHMYHSKDRFARGQRPNTRANNAIQLLHTKLLGDAERYRTAYNALCRLSPQLDKDVTQWSTTLRLLQDSDLRHLAEGENDDPSESRRTMSWIWRTHDLSIDAAQLGGQAVKESLQESLRIEWCKARARARRWTEECALLKEEMRRVIAYHEWSSNAWLLKIARPSATPDYAEGMGAYARRQADIRLRMKASCERAWRYVDLWDRLGTDDAPVVPDTGALTDLSSSTPTQSSL